MELTAFKLYLFKKGLKSTTIDRRLIAIEYVTRLAGSLEKEKAEAALLSLLENGKTGRYVNILLESVHSWADFTNNVELRSIPYFPEKPYQKATLSDEEIEAFLALPCPMIIRKGPKGIEYTVHNCRKRWEKMQMFWSIFAYTGMRPGEITHLTVHDVDWGRGVFVVAPEVEKTGNGRFVPIPQQIVQRLKEYIVALEGDYLFPSRRGALSPLGKPVIRSGLWGTDFRQRMKRLEIKRKNLTAYSLRHSFITRLLNEDVNLFKVQKIVGHRSIETTATYVHLTTKDIIRTMEKDPLAIRHIDPRTILSHLRETIDHFSLTNNPKFDSAKVEKAIGDFLSALWNAIV